MASPAPPQEQQQQQQQKSRLNRAPTLDTWDCVDPVDEKDLQVVHDKLAQQLGGNVTDYWRRKYEEEAKRYWNEFYKRNSNRFFKDRHYLQRMFSEIPTDEAFYTSGERRVLLECGCGVGNALLPLCEDYPLMHFVGVELAPSAIEVLKNREEYAAVADRVQLCVCDVSTEELPPMAMNVDFVTLIYVLSAVKPERHADVVRRVFQALKPGGVLFIRDYALYDMTQLRFRKESRLADNYYVRQDGTTSYFFSTAELNQLLTAAGFNILNNIYQRKIVRNRKKELEMQRVFVYAAAQRPT